MSEEQNSQLVSMYDDPAWKEAQHLEPYKKPKAWAWRIAGMLAIAMLMVVFAFGMVAGGGLLVGLLFFGLVMLVCLLIAAFLSALLAIIPHKHIDYIERVYIVLPFMMVILELVLIGSVLFFSSNPVW
jgi:hypothetical protein